MRVLTLTIFALVTLSAVAQRVNSIPPCAPNHPSCCLDDPNGCGVFDLKVPNSSVLSHPLKLTVL